VDIAAQMVLFAQVVENEGFSATSRKLGQTPSSVSKQIGALEDKLGVRLLKRSTRRIALTEEGRALYPRCRAIAQDVEAAHAMAVSLGKRPQGTLRVASTVAFGKAQILPILSTFLHRHPDVKITLDLIDAPVDLTSSGHDMAIRFTEQIENSAAIARKLATNRRIVCAAPSYLNARGTPATPSDLTRHNCLRLSAVQHWNDWYFRDASAADGVAMFHARGNFEANDADAIYHAALEGLGLARLPLYLIADDVRSGRLVPVLPDHSDMHADIYAVYDDRRNLSPAVRSFIDFLVETFRPVPPWERAALDADSGQAAAE
jgi:DNA-binding transcriptional LysR family regulator